MLTHLTIQNYALITHLSIDFEEGFSVITGETGAGKSIILGALGLLMGARADARAITEGEEKCVIEGEFDIRGYGLEGLFEEEDLDLSDTCIIRRELTRAGKSRSFVNDSPIRLTALRTLSAKLIDIHSQHENLLLADSDFQLRIVDSLADNKAIREQYQAAYTAYRATEHLLRDLRERADNQRTDHDYLQFQYDQLSEANLQGGELPQLEEELTLLEHAEEIKSALSNTCLCLNGEDQSALSAVRTALSELHDAVRLLPDGSEVAALHERLNSAYIEIKDIADEAERQEGRIEYSPERQAMLSERIDLLQSLLQKHHLHTEEELIDLRDSLEQQLTEIDSYDEEIAHLEKQLEQELKFVEKVAAQLTKSRRAVEAPLAERLQTNLLRLGIAHAAVALQIEATPDYTADGADSIQILFAANKNQTLRPVSTIASGGEMARIMLCIKALIADSTGLATIIFDEIDTGVSGEVASQMGAIMHDMAAGRQIISITHLPQIAARGSMQYKVYKQDTDVRTETHICRLTDEERVVEIAKLLSGEELTEAAISNAKHLLAR